MQEVNYKKLNRSIKMYPIFYGLTADLIFWITINTLFLTKVKYLSASEINSLEAIEIAIGLLFQLFFIKIVRKIENSGTYEGLLKKCKSYKELCKHEIKSRN